jgi:NAD-dependent SIR2 family protein deacetylase
MLLGAGVSVDAGIPTSFNMTKAVYEELRRQRYKEQAVIFGYVRPSLPEDEYCRAALHLIR